MIGSVIRRALNVRELLRQRRASKAALAGGNDAELELYASIFQSDFLHAGYFGDPHADIERMGLADMRDAMRAYSDLLVRRLAAGETVLDVGCGRGALLGLLREAGVNAAGLTPSARHAAHIRERYPGVTVIESRFQTLDTAPWARRFDAVVCLESFHNVPLDAGMRGVREIVKPLGKWVVLDYYRLRPNTYNRSGHLLPDYQAALARHGFRIEEELDVTENVLPSLAFAHLLATRLGLPLLAFARHKLALRYPVLAYLFAENLNRAVGRIRLDALDPEVFRRDKRYLLHQLSL